MTTTKAPDHNPRLLSEGRFTVRGTTTNLADELAILIDEVEQDRIDDANSAEDSGERPDLWGYEVPLDLDKAKAILAALRAKPAGDGVREQYRVLFIKAADAVNAWINGDKFSQAIARLDICLQDQSNPSPADQPDAVCPQCDPPGSGQECRGGQCGHCKGTGIRSAAPSQAIDVGSIMPTPRYKTGEDIAKHLDAKENGRG